MTAVRSRNTGPEVALRRMLFAHGVRGWRCNYEKASGSPDLAWPARKVAVFVDGAFWHGHPSRYKVGQSGEYWDAKINANIARDQRVNADLEVHGWKVVRVWDFELRRSPEDVLTKIIDALIQSASCSARTPQWLAAIVKQMTNP